MSFNERHKHRHHDAGVNLPVSPSDVINGLRIQHPQFNIAQLINVPWAMENNERTQIVGFREFVPKQLMASSNRGREIDFSDSSVAGLNTETLLVTSAVLQAARIRRNPESIVPRRFSEELVGENGQLTNWFQEGRHEHRRASWEEKINFCRQMQSLLHHAIADPRFDAHSAFNLFLLSYQIENPDSQGFGIFEAFFPQLSQLLDENIEIDISSPHLSALADINRSFGIALGEKATRQVRDGMAGIRISNLVHELIDIRIRQAKTTGTHFNLIQIIRDIGMIGRSLKLGEYFNQTDFAVELGILNNLYPQSIAIIMEIRPELLEDIDWSAGRTEIEEKIRSLHQISLEPVYTHMEPLDPRNFGLKINERETQMMRQYFDQESAFVVSPEAIKGNARGYWQFQREIIRKIAERENLDINIPVPYPATLLPHQISSDADEAVEEQKDAQRKVFRTHEKFLRERGYDWLLLLLYPQVQEKYLEQLPFCSVPPYVVVNDQAVPVQMTSQERLERKDWINELPFFNYIDQRKRIRQRLTVIGVFLKKVLDSGGLPIVNHGMARAVLGGWLNDIDFDPDSFVYDSDVIPKLDADVLIFNRGEQEVPSPGLLIRQLLDRNSDWHRYLIGSTIFGRTMTEALYGIIAKSRRLKYYVKNDTWRVAHDPNCILHAFKGLGRERDQFIQTFLGLSRIRSFGLVPFMVGEGIAVKAIDPFGGMIDYVEGNNGIALTAGEKITMKNVIRFISRDESFPIEKPTMAVWHILRTIADIVFTKNGGIFLPEGLGENYADTDAWASAKIGARQFREIVIKVAEELPNILKKLSAEQMHDLRHELRKIQKADEVLGTDPLTFLILCSGDELENSFNYPQARWQSLLREKGLLGVELSRLYPHIHLFRNNRDLWKEILNKLREGQKKEDETGSQFLARIIWDIPRARNLISSTIRREFIKDNASVYRVGTKLLNASVAEMKEGLSATGNWLVLDAEGIGKWARYPQIWTRFIKVVSNGQVFSGKDGRSYTFNQFLVEYCEDYKRRTKQSINMVQAVPDAIQSFANNTQGYFNRDNVRGINRWPEDKKRAIEKEQIDTLANWLVEPDY